MPHPSFIRAEASGARAVHDSLLGLQAEYLSWVHGEMARCFPALNIRDAGLPRSEGSADVVQALCTAHPPGNVLYLIAVNGEAAGMCGLRSLGDSNAEIKRLYVRPAYRGMRLGSSALSRLLADARSWGYARIHLDTALFMQAAHRLYEAHGFTDCAAYEGTEVPVALHGDWRFMQRAITPHHP
jgi:GNAT superfamily N-acetyltransferase